MMVGNQGVHIVRPANLSIGLTVRGESYQDMSAHTGEQQANMATSSPPSTETATASTETATQEDLDRAPEEVIHEKMVLSRKRNELLKRKGELIRLEAELAALDLKNEDMEEEYALAIADITDRRERHTAGKQDLNILKYRGSLTTKISNAGHKCTRTCVIGHFCSE